MRHDNPIIAAAALLGLSGVALGAFGAHALANLLEEREMAYVWETAVTYHFVHSLALLALGIWSRFDPDNKLLRPTAILWVLGVLIFSGSLYIIAVGGPTAVAPFTPLGGIFFLLGWGLLLPASARNGSARSAADPVPHSQ
ncbi:MAG: DUF423 domain-containing protein [Opitutales bacterium]